MIISPEKPNSIIILSRQDPSPSALESIPRNSVVFGWHRPGRRRNTSPALGFLQKTCINLTDLFQANLELDWLLGRQQVLICCLFAFFEKGNDTPENSHVKKHPNKKLSKSHVSFGWDDVMDWKKWMISIQGGPRKTSYKLSYGAPITRRIISYQENPFNYRAIYFEITLQWIGNATRRCPSHLKWWR